MTEIHIFDVESLVEIMKQRRKHLKITQTELANFAGMTKVGISKIEKGASDPKLSTVLRLCQLLGIKIIAKTPGDR